MRPSSASCSTARGSSCAITAAGPAPPVDMVDRPMVPDRAIDRRSLLRLAASAAGTLWLPRSAWSQPRWPANPFGLGVASGSPRHDSVVLWTRLVAPGVFQSLGDGAIQVRWELAHDEQFSRIVQGGQSPALSELAHSVHVEVAGLEPDRWYFYRFIAGDAVSAT